MCLKPGTGALHCPAKFLYSTVALGYQLSALKTLGKSNVVSNQEPICQRVKGVLKERGALLQTQQSQSALPEDTSSSLKRKQEQGEEIWVLSPSGALLHYSSYKRTLESYREYSQKPTPLNHENTFVQFYRNMTTFLCLSYWYIKYLWMH